jgi:hypothetical protein
VLNSAQELLAQGNVTLPALRMDLVTVGDAGPSGLNFTHALVLSNGRVHAAGPLADVLTSATLTSAFGVSLTVTRTDGRYTARGSR